MEWPPARTAPGRRCSGRNRRRSPPDSPGTFAAPLALGLLLSWGSIAFAADPANPRKLYPELAQRADSIVSIHLVADASVVVDVFGPIENVRLLESVEYARRSLECFGDRLEAHGYPVGRRTVLSIGGLVRPDAEFRAVNEEPPRRRANPGGPEPAPVDGPQLTPPADTLVLRPLFWRHRLLADSTGLEADWRALVAQVGAFQRPPGSGTPRFPEAVRLGERLGADVLGLVLFVSVEHGLAKGLVRAATSGAMVASLGVGLPGSGGGFYRFALIDCREGTLLWSAFALASTPSLDGLRFRATELTDPLPRKKR